MNRTAAAYVNVETMQHALKLLALLPLACASSAIASPDRAAPTRHTDACRPGGAVVFEIDHRIDPGAKIATSAVKVFASGAWTRDETDADGKPGAQRLGCLAKPEIAQLQDTLAGAAWKVNVKAIRCMAMSAEFTVYQVNGKTVFTRRLCNGESLDDKSRTKLDAAIAMVEGELDKAAPKP
jgi:hypothetical protein